MKLDYAICGRLITEKLSTGKQKFFANQKFFNLNLGVLNSSPFLSDQYCIIKKCYWQIYVRLSPLHYPHPSLSSAGAESGPETA